MEALGPLGPHHSGLTSFELLVATVLSQHTSDRNSERAFNQLSKVFAIRPHVLAAADEASVRAAIRVAGLQRQKTKAIIALANAVQERFRRNLSKVLTLDTEKAREALMDLPGVGPKTADMVLLFSGGAATFPIDTHITRVSKRLGFVPKNAGYEQMRTRLQSLFQPEEYLSAHLLLIRLGRGYCTAARPRHDVCPVRDHCPKLMDCP